MAFSTHTKSSRSSRIVICGGGLAGIFSAYHLLCEARRAGQTLDVVVLADKLNVPCTAGSHLVKELEGLFHDDVPNRPRIKSLIETSLTRLRQTVQQEEINCQLNMGYEVKGRTREDVSGIVHAVVEKDIYGAQEINADSYQPVFNLPGYDHCARLDSIGQINMLQLLNGLVKKIRDMGGQVIEGARYESQDRTDTGYIIRSNVGVFETARKPLIATGAAHMSRLPGFDFTTEVAYTMGVVLPGLKDEDAIRISPQPMAFSDSALDGDVLWGGLDAQKNFTIGRGHITQQPEQHREGLMRELYDFIDARYPGLLSHYEADISFGAMMIAENRMPIVGRMRDYDVMGGWAGMGIVAGFAAAQSYAHWIVDKDDDDLRLFEAMQPGDHYLNAQEVADHATGAYGI